MKRFSPGSPEFGYGVDGFLLKPRSPSCGFKDVKNYRGFDAAQGHENGTGFFGGAVLQGFSGLPVEDEGEKNIVIN